MSQPAIELRGIRNQYGDTTALHGLDLVVPFGQVCGLLGPNGAGKSTALRIVAGILRPDGGRARLAGYDLVGQPLEARRALGFSA